MTALRTLAAAAFALALAVPVTTQAVWAADPAPQAPSPQAPSPQAPSPQAPSPQAPPASANMQGDQQAWIKDPHIHAFYQLTVAAFAGGAANVDRVRFKHDAFEIFRDFGRTTGMGGDAMVEHLKLIPDQVVQIATEDPKVLASYDAFIAAVMGPQ
jgi:hypothetical protein